MKKFCCYIDSFILKWYEHTIGLNYFITFFDILQYFPTIIYTFV